MSTERGMLLKGRVLPGTDFVLREPGAWWEPGERGTRERTGSALLVGHWTAGRPHEGPGTAGRVVRAMKARLRDDGSPMDVGIGFVIGWDGLVYQTADLSTATVHVSSGWNPRSYGVECCWPGTEKQAQALGVVGLGGRVDRVEVAGARARLLAPSPELLAAWVRLAEALHVHAGVPRVVPLDAAGAVLRDRMTPKRARQYAGAAEHLHSPSTTKIDAGGYLVSALLAAGWKGTAA